MATIHKTAPVAAGRLTSLDFFRGATIAAMIVVNNPGNDYPFEPLKHAEWNGWTLTDLIFPFFLFIVGVSLVLSTASRLSRGESKQSSALHAFRRAIIIFLIGLILNGLPRFTVATWRIPGVLQRIALCYLISALLYLGIGKGVRWAVVAGCLIGYWVLMRFVPVPGFGLPTVHVPLLDPDKNLAAWFDRKLMEGHLYEGTRDPEGVLSTIPAVATCLMGVFTGEWIRNLRNTPLSLLRRLVLVGAIAIILGESWALIFPINKKLWTSSYVLLTAGLATWSLALCYYVFDLRQWKSRWITPALVLGTNAITAYSLAALIAIAGASVPFTYRGQKVIWQEWVYLRLFASMPPAWGSLAFSLFFLAVCFVPIWLLWRKRVFIKI